MVRLVVLLVALSWCAACSHGGSPDFCDVAAHLESANLGAGAGTLETHVKQALDTLDELVDVAPDAIVGDVTVVRDGVKSFVRTNKAPGPRFAPASRRLGRYIETHCSLPTSSSAP